MGELTEYKQNLAKCSKIETEAMHLEPKLDLYNAESLLEGDLYP